MPAFTRQHYESIAAALCDEFQSATDLWSRTAIHSLVDRLAQRFAADNPAFNPRRFRAAVYRDGVD